MGLAALPARSKEAALLLKPDPGASTVPLTGVNSTPGAGLIEFCEAP